MKKYIVAIGALVALAIPTAAFSTVAVNDGVGFAGKGDVQDALGLANDAAMQDLFKKQPNGAAIKFTTSYNMVLDNTINCMKYDPSVWPPFVNTGDTYHVINTTPVTQNVKATANTNAAGKLTNGWNLNGFDGPATYGPVTTVKEGACPSGTFNGSTASQVPTVSTPSLKVNDYDLPNTPVEPVIAPVS